jgi:hypothetical protein
VAPQYVEVLRPELRGIARELLDVLAHGPIRIVDRRRTEVELQRVDERIIQRNVTQKLCV